MFGDGIYLAKKLLLINIIAIGGVYGKSIFKFIYSNTIKLHIRCCCYFRSEQYGGIKPPVLRSEMDFDPASKFHIAANIPYIR